MNNISFEGIGEVVATFACGEEVKAGQVVKLTENGTVGPCTDGEPFCGVALSAQDGHAAVQLKGLITLPVTAGSITPGWVKLSADASGGVKQNDSTGMQYLVVAADSSSVTAYL